MNVFDFDGTLYKGDSTLDFYIYCLRKWPHLAKRLPRNIIDAMRFGVGMLSRQDFKQRFFESFVGEVPIPYAVDGFWAEHRKKLMPWYKEAAHEGDVVISASPVFLLEPICSESGLSLIATIVDESSGQIIGKNMRGEEKVRALRVTYGLITPETFYTDSMADLPMIRISRRAFMVKHGVPEEILRRP